MSRTLLFPYHWLIRANFNRRVRAEVRRGLKIRADAKMIVRRALNSCVEIIYAGGDLYSKDFVEADSIMNAAAAVFVDQGGSLDELYGHEKIPSPMPASIPTPHHSQD